MVSSLDRFRSWLDALTDTGSGRDASGDSAQQRDAANARVTALLLVEIARSNHDIDTSELNAITSSLRATSSLAPGEVEVILEEALAEADSAVSLHEHVRIMNERLEKPAKLELIESMWRVAIADGRIDHHEEHTVRKLSDLLHVKHRDFMQVKLRVLDASES